MESILVFNKCTYYSVCSASFSFLSKNCGGKDPKHVKDFTRKISGDKRVKQKNANRSVGFRPRNLTLHGRCGVAFQNFGHQSQNLWVNIVSPGKLTVYTTNSLRYLGDYRSPTPQEDTVQRASTLQNCVLIVNRSSQTQKLNIVF